MGSKLVFSEINEKTVLKFLRINEKKGRISHNTLSPLHNCFKEDQETVPTTTHEEAEVGSQGAQEKV